MRLALVVMLAGCTGTIGARTDDQGDHLLHGDEGSGDSLMTGDGMTSGDAVVSGDATVAGDAASSGDSVDAGDSGPEIVPVPGAHTPFDLGELTVPAERLPNWTTVGVGGGVPNTEAWPRVNAIDHGVTPNDASDDDAAGLNDAITYAASSYERAVVFLPAGEYTIVQPNQVRLASNVVLQGAGPDETVIHSVMGSSASSAISVSGSSGGQEIELVGGLDQGSTVLTLAATPSFAAGDFVLVQQDDDERIASEAYHAKGIGQVVKVIEINGSEVTIEPYLRVYLNPSANPRISKPTFVTNSGVEDLTVDVGDVASVPLYRGATIVFKYAVNSWLRNVESFNAYHIHASLQYSARVTLEGNLFEGMQKTDYTNAYTIDFGALASDCLGTNNIIRDVWVSAIFSHSCNGNVYAYNFHTEMREDHGIIHHGTYPFENLVEGNDAYRITNDCWWGKQGPRLTFLRNRASEIRTSRNGACENHGNIVAEQATFLLNVANYYLSFPWCSYPDGCAAFDDFNAEMWVEKNRYRTDFKGVDEPQSTNTLIDNQQGTAVPQTWDGLSLPQSLYLSRRPDFWCDELPWPAIGADVDDDAALNTLPAERRYRGLPCSH